MPISHAKARSVLRVALPLAVAAGAAAMTVGCPTPPAAKTAQGDTGGGPLPTATPAPTATPRPASSRTPAPTETPVVFQATPTPTPIPTPSGYYDTPTPAPTAKATPGISAMGVEISMGATTSSPYERNQFRIRYSTSVDTPDFPASRSYQALRVLGYPVATEGIQAGPREWTPIPVTWTLKAPLLVHSNTESAALPQPLVYFRDSTSTPTRIEGKESVVIETATVSPGILLTFEAVVEIAASAEQAGAGYPTTATASIYAYNEGKVEFEITSFERRFPRPARLVP